MKIIKLYINENLAGEGGATDEKDLHSALEMILKAIKGIPGARVEVKEGELDELVEDFRGRFLTTYTVKGTYSIGSNEASVSMEIKAVSREEALEKAKELGLMNPYIEEYYDEDDYQDEEEYDEDEDNDEEDEEDDKEHWDRIEHEVCGDCSHFDDCLWRKRRSGCRWR